MVWRTFCGASTRPGFFSAFSLVICHLFCNFWGGLRLDPGSSPSSPFDHLSSVICDRCVIFHLPFVIYPRDKTCSAAPIPTLKKRKAPSGKPIFGSRGPRFDPPRTRFGSPGPPLGPAGSGGGAGTALTQAKLLGSPAAVRFWAPPPLRARVQSTRGPLARYGVD